MLGLRAVPPLIPAFLASLAERAVDASRYSPPAPGPAVGVTPAKHRTGLQVALGDRQNLKVLGQKLYEVAARLGASATPEVVLAALDSTPMDIDRASSYPLAVGSNITLATFIRHLGFSMPSSHFHLTSLADGVNEKILEPPLGDFGGGLSWPLPLNRGEQRRLDLLTQNHFGDQAQAIEGKGVLGFLHDQEGVPAPLLSNPAKVLETLVGSAEGQRLGKHLQEQMGGIATDRSASDYLLAAITLQMDTESIVAPHRNEVAGFDLANDAHWGKPASVVVQGLSKHLSTRGKISPEMAEVGAYVLLARKAPEFLIKDIPARVTYGSMAWVNLAVAAATIESQSPGKVANMSFAQVMQQAASAGLADPGVTRHAQQAALVDWGVINGVLERKEDERYTDEELNTLQKTFNARQQQMINASQSLDKDIPSRKALALAVLKQRFGDLGELFEEKLINTTSQPRGGPGAPATRLVGHHSLLDIAMMDLPSPAVFYSADERIPLAKLNANYRFGITEAFNQQFKATIQSKKLAIPIAIKQLIAHLPLEDRKNFEYGKITFYQRASHRLGLGFADKTQYPNDPVLLVKTEREGKPVAYEINFAQGVIQKTDLWRAQERSSRTANLVHETKVFIPEGSDADKAKERTPVSQTQLDSFATPRTQYIADAFVENFDLDNPGRPRKLSATPDLSGTVLPLCPIPNSASKSAPSFNSVKLKASA
ncbi:hypothetical protein HBO16_27085, partial [Pseudomonas gessardii]|nr:hypothetical protein [Pseudomonas gessardii]